MVSILSLGRLFATQNSFSMTYVELTWTLTPFFFVLAVLVPIFFSLSFFESYSFLWGANGIGASKIFSEDILTFVDLRSMPQAPFREQ